MNVLIDEKVDFLEKHQVAIERHQFSGNLILSYLAGSIVRISIEADLQKSSIMVCEFLDGSRHVKHKWTLRELAAATEISFTLDCDGKNCRVKVLDSIELAFRMGVPTHDIDRLTLSEASAVVEFPKKEKADTLDQSGFKRPAPVGSDLIAVESISPKPKPDRGINDPSGKISPLKSSNELLPEYIRAVLREFETFNLQTVRHSLRPLPDPQSPIAISVVKNEFDRLHDFFRHYREAGIERFCFIDNGSSDGTLEYLCAQPDTDVFIADSKFDWMRKQGWINRAAVGYGLNRWLMYLDADELIVFDGIETKTFRDLTLELDRRGICKARGFLVDMYADCPLLEGGYQPHSRLLEAYPYFDASGYREEHYKEIISIKGGPRTRVFGADEPKFRPEMTKYPLFKLKENEFMVNPHHCWPYNKNFSSERLLAVLHFKFLPGIVKKINDAIASENYWDGSFEYKCYLKILEKDRKASLMHKHSRRYTTSADLIALGMIQAIEWHADDILSEHVNAEYRKARARLVGSSALAEYVSRTSFNAA